MNREVKMVQCMPSKLDRRSRITILALGRRPICFPFINKSDIIPSQVVLTISYKPKPRANKTTMLGN